MTGNAPPLPASVRVRAPGRLHLGFLDPAGTLGRRFGSLGLVVDGPATVLELRRAATEGSSAGTPTAAAELPRAAEHLAALRRATRQSAPLHLQLAETLPAHAGFGSGTQLALAIGRAFGALCGLSLPKRRPSEPAGSRKPRCSRPGARTRADAGRCDALPVITVGCTER